MNHRVIQAAVVCILVSTTHLCSADGKDPCDRLNEIKELPFKNEAVQDEVYNSLVMLREKAIPCLIDKLTDTTPMKDPRKVPPCERFAVGDAAHCVLTDITKVPFEEFLPTAVKERYLEIGADAYFEYVQRPENRVQLQKRWGAWFQKRVVEGVEGSGRFMSETGSVHDN